MIKAEPAGSSEEDERGQMREGLSKTKAQTNKAAEMNTATSMICVGELIHEPAYPEKIGPC